MGRPFGEQFEPDTRWCERARHELVVSAAQAYMRFIGECQDEEFIRRMSDSEGSYVKITNSLSPEENGGPTTRVSVLHPELGCLAVTYSGKATIENEKWVSPSRLQHLCKLQEQAS